MYVQLIYFPNGIGKASRVLHFLVVLVFMMRSADSTSARFYTEPVKRTVDGGLLPWIGVLRVEEECSRAITTLSEGQEIDAITGLILIDRQIAIANANDIANIYRDVMLSNATKAMFYRPDYMPWYCDVTEYIIHPEYKDNSLNTIALLKLDYDRRNFQWKIITWPNMKLEQHHNVYLIGFTDQRKVLEQVKYEMDFVNSADCINFYSNEEIDFKSLWPNSFQCYRTKHNLNKCVYDAGMTLATNYTGTWTLLGISVYGPGCTLPSRFIEFYPYIPWIKANSASFRRSGSKNLAPQGLYDPYDDWDTYFLSLVDNKTMVLRPLLANKKEVVYGKCDHNDGKIAYRDKGQFKVQDHSTGGYAVAVYALSLYDVFFSEYTCVTVTVNGYSRSTTKFWFDKGFHQDDIEPYLKVVPFKMFRDRTYPPKILYLMDKYKKYHNMQTTNLLFKFEFYEQGSIDVEFYGKPAIATTTEPTSPMTTAHKYGSTRKLTSRSTRSYATRFKYTTKSRGKRGMKQTYSTKKLFLRKLF